MKTRLSHASLLLALLLVAACFITLSPQIAYAETIIVDTTDYGASNDANCSLFEAIQAANSNAAVDNCLAGNASPIVDMIVLTNTTYPISGVAGDFDGDTGLPDITSAMIITGDSSIIARNVITPLRILHVNTGGELTVQNVTLSNGQAENGGVIYNLGVLTVSESIIMSGTASVDGGGLYNNGASATFTASHVLSNVAGDEGGGIHNTFTSTVTADNSNIAQNRAANGGGIFGGNDSAVVLNNSVVSTNTATSTGGGINVTGTSTVLTTAGGTVEANSAGNGGGLVSTQGTVTITGTQFLSNTATGSGAAILFVNESNAKIINATISRNLATDQAGGIQNDSLSVLSIENSVITLNRSDFGGAIFNSSSGVLTVTNSTIATNTTTSDGGGLFSGGNFHLQDADFIANVAAGNGGAIFNDDGKESIVGGRLFDNRAVNGGAIYNVGADSATLEGVTIISNSVTADGGGLWNFNGTLTITDTRFENNDASANGGGLYITNSVASIITGTLVANRAGNDGGAVRQGANSTLLLDSTELVSNSAVNNGGGISSQNSDPDIVSSNFLSNTAGNNGGALHNTDAIVVISDSVMVANRAVTDGGAIANVAPSILNVVGGEYRNNQAVNGGMLSNNGIVNIGGTRILTNTASTNGGAIHQRANGATTVSQSCIVGNSDNAVHHVGGPAITAANNWWGGPNGPSGVGPGSGDSVSTNVSFMPFHNFAILGCPGDPAVAWSASAYVTNETSGNFTATVLLSPTVSASSVTVIATISGQPQQTVTFPPNSSSQPVVIQVVNDSVYTAQVIKLGLQSPSGAILGVPVSATLTITDDESPSVVLAVSKVANLTSARVGDLITYTYRITNTGQTPLTAITATDDKLGEVTGLAGALAVGATRTATAGYVVQMADFHASPLVNTITVLGSTSTGATTQDDASASVTIRRWVTNSPLIKKDD